MKKKEVIKPKSDPITGKTLIIVAIILSVGAILFSVIQDRLRTNKIKEDRAYEEQQNQKRLGNLANCLGVVDETYSRSWNIECVGQGMDIYCNLPLSLADRLAKEKNEQRDACYKAFNK